MMGPPLRHLNLFTGAGGSELGAKLLGWETLGYVEWDPYCQKVIKQRIKDGIYDFAPTFGDIRAFVREGYARRYRGMVDVLSAGFPCQPFSVAGKQKAVDDERNMWPATRDVICEVEPGVIILENVPGLLAGSHGYFGTILRELAESGYDARWRVLSAAEMGAPHKRDRLWIVAYPKSSRGGGLSVFEGRQIQKRIDVDGAGETILPDTDSAQCVGLPQRTATENTIAGKLCAMGDPEYSGRSTSEITGSTSQGSDGSTTWAESASESTRPSEQCEELAYTRCEHGCQGNATGVEGAARQRTSCDLHNQSSGKGLCDISDTNRSGLQGCEFGRGVDSERWKITDGSTSECSSSWWDVDPADVFNAWRIREVDGGFVRKQDVIKELIGGVEPQMGRVANGVACRTDRLRAIGNGQVPAVFARAWLELSEGLI